MNARQAAAQFAARTWYEEVRAGRQTPDEAARFAEGNWSAFLPVAAEGWGRLLLKMGRTQRRKRRRSVAAAG
jgi:hypothetical protein